MVDLFKPWAPQLTSHRLYFKSTHIQPDSTTQNLSKDDQHSDSAYLHLVTLEKSFHVRQVSTSNSVYVSKLHEDVAKGQSTADGSLDSHDKQALVAVAKVPTVLELIPTKTDVEATLKKLLPAYDMNPINGAGSYVHPTRIQKKWLTKTEVYANIPAPDSHVDAIYRRLFITEIADLSLFLPSDAVLWAAWQSIAQTCVLAGVRIDRDDRRAIETAIETVGKDEVTAPLDAIIGSILSNNDLWTENGQIRVVTVLGWTRRWLRSTQDASDTVAAFVTTWQSTLPEAWWEQAEEFLLQHCRVTANFDASTSNKLYRVEGREALVSDLEPADSAGSAPPAKLVMVTGKRKWHEKFKESRNAKR